jgi:hypothetical protein
MDSQSKRNYRRVLIALAIIAIVVSAGIAFNLSYIAKSSSTTPTTTTVVTSTQVNSQTSTMPLTSTKTATSSFESQLFNVTFRQVIMACPSGGPPQPAKIPWGVTIGNQTVVQPPGTPLPLNGNTTISAAPNATLAKLTFFLPPGSYRYQVVPSLAFSPNSGNVDVQGSTVIVDIPVPPWFCMSVTEGSISVNNRA